MISFSEYLITESRVEVLRDKYREPLIRKISEHNRTRSIYAVEDGIFPRLWRQLEDTDPTANKQYLDWLVRQYLADDLIVQLPGQDSYKVRNLHMLEDLDTIRDAIFMHSQYKRQLPPVQRDINFFKSYYSLRSYMNQFEATPSNNEVKRDEVAKFKSQIDVIYDGGDGKIMVPKSYDASKYLGRGTKWCTAMATTDHWFKEYHLQGPLFVLIHPDGSKYQLHSYAADNINWVDPRHEVSYMNHLDEPSNIGLFFKSNLWQHLAKAYEYAPWTFVLAGHQMDDKLGKKIATHLKPDTRKYLFNRGAKNYHQSGWDVYLRKVFDIAEPE